jgi:8-oxo-dGTP pyrophosphatase MutT (NUDIX family)
MYPNRFYRVAAKALITDEKGRVLIVKESNDTWGLPGGGINHGEIPQECIKREINEELGIDNTKVNEILGTKIFFLDRMDTWMIWIIYKAKLNSSNFVYGDGITDAKFILPSEFKDSKDMFEKAVSEIGKFIQA